jgi:hypothetical protein
MAGWGECKAAITATGFFAMTVRKARAEASGVRRRAWGLKRVLRKADCRHKKKARG